MINDKVTGADEHVDPERTLALAYAPLEVRPGVTALFALDDMLARILRTTTEPDLQQLTCRATRDNPVPHHRLVSVGRLT